MTTFEFFKERYDADHDYMVKSLKGKNFGRFKQ